MQREMREGKLPAADLRSLLGRVPRADASVVVGPSTGEDAAALLLPEGERIVVATADPVTFATQSPGWYAVHVNANDVATRGAQPRWFLATLLLPPDAPSDLPRTLVDEIVEACASVGAALVGGHTEVTPHVRRPIVAGTMLGSMRRDSLQRSSAAQVGDALFLTQGIAIEGTAILGAEALTALGDLDAETLASARGLLSAPGISVVAAAMAVRDVDRIHAMHDPTEGGLATAVHELCDAADTGVELHAASVPLLLETRVVCAALKLDAFGLLASGALLVSAHPSAEQELLARWRDIGVPAARVGRLTHTEAGRWLLRDGVARPLPRFDQDELARYFERIGSASR